MCLQDPQLAKKNLLSSMEKFRSDMENCAAKANQIESKFDVLVKTATEVKLAMADELSKLQLDTIFIGKCIS